MVAIERNASAVVVGQKLGAKWMHGETLEPSHSRDVELGGTLYGS